MKKVLAFLLAILLLTMVVGCGSAPEATDDGASVDQSVGDEPIDISEEEEVQTGDDEPIDISEEEEVQKLVIWTNLTAEAQATVLNKQFTEVAEEMDIEFEMVTVSFGDMYTKLATAVESGEVPDIMHTNFAGAAYLYSQDMITGLDDVIDEVGRDDFISTYVRVLTVDDTAWGIPDWALHTSVWYRKDLFEQYNLEIPTNWEEFEAVANTLNIDEDGDGNTDIYGFPIPLNPVQVAAQTYYEFLYSAGVYTVDPDTGEYVFGSQKEEATAALEYMVNLYNEASPPAALDWSWSEYRNALVEGTVAMTLDMGAVVLMAQTNNPDMVANLGRFDFPGPDGFKYGSFGSGYAFVASNQGSDEKIDLTKEFLARLYTPERAAERALSRPMFAFPSMYSALDIYKQDDSVALFQNEIETITESFENTNWYWYGMEHGLSQLSSQIEATTFIGEALQSVALGMETASEAVDFIDEQLQEQIEIIAE